MKKSEQIRNLIKDVKDLPDKVEVIIENGFAVSKSEARRLVHQIGVNKEEKSE